MRRKMDDDGYLPVSLIASFHRVEALTRDIKLVIQAVEDSEVVEITDGVKVRAEVTEVTEGRAEPVGRVRSEDAVGGGC